MAGVLAVLYGTLTYAFFFATFLYAIGFVGNLPLPKTIDTGTGGPLLESLLVNLVLLGVFAVQHSVMARPAFKRWWTRLVPPAVERSTYVLFATLALALLLWQWRPMPERIWAIEQPVAAMAITAVFWLGWAVLLLSTFLINHFELFGLSQVFRRLRNRPPGPVVFRTPFLYRLVRHPIYLGFLLAFWAAPVMTVGHLLFAVGTTGYILIGILLEERDLVAEFGDQYRQYRKQVPMLVPLPRGRAPAEGQDATPTFGLKQP